MKWGDKNARQDQPVWFFLLLFTMQAVPVGRSVPQNQEIASFFSGCFFPVDSAEPSAFGRR